MAKFWGMRDSLKEQIRLLLANKKETPWRTTRKMSFTFSKNSKGPKTRCHTPSDWLEVA